MKKNIILLLVLLCAVFSNVQSQDTPSKEKEKTQEDKIARLMGEREQLVLEYQYLNQQNNSFWGNKSKKDLLSIIDTLKELIRKDSELIAAVKEASIKKIAKSTVENQRSGKQIVVDQRQINNRIQGLQNQVDGLQNQLKRREAVVKDLQLQLQEADEKRYGKDKVISVLAIVSAILLLYAIILQVRLNNAKAKPKTARKKNV
ncbi:hypothetical protein [Pontibacter pudoricolor]|uniref:hypothetical protein n=1 Tax=Pontibacter pudoricolor TaxID=2694930 RepID=UPI001EE4E119|nr:hypothetical protein [Pontibacter pudoricolor]